MGLSYFVLQEEVLLYYSYVYCSCFYYVMLLYVINTGISWFLGKEQSFYFARICD
jgi:hypothetical protein